MRIEGFKDEYKELGERLHALFSEWPTAGIWRSYKICGEVADIIWERLPMIINALLHHSDGQKAQWQLTRWRRELTAEPTCAQCGSARACCEDCNPEVEREAAALWRAENPEMNVFACDVDIQNAYRRRVLEQRSTVQRQEGERA